jgi:Zn-dependent protease/predicted transcriptional regulator
MTGDIYLGRLLGVPLRLHWSWFLAVYLIAWTLAVGFFPQTLPEYGGDGPVYWGLGLLAALGLFVSVLLHELGHEILIALGGPAVTLVLIVLYYVGLRLVVAAGALGWDATDGTLHLQGGSLLAAGAAGLLYYLGMINTMVLVFNLVPAFPLDGGRVLRGIVWSATGEYLTSTRIAGGVGIAFSWLLFLGGFLTAFRGNLLGGVWLFFLGTFLRNAAQSSVAYAQLQQLLSGVRVADLMRRKPVTINADLTLREVADQFFLRYPHKAYPVVQDGDFVGMLTLRDLQGTERDQWEVVRAGDLARGHGSVPVAHPREPVLQALRKLAESGQSRLAIVENGTLVGLLCHRDVMDLMEVRSGLALPRERRAVADETSREYAVLESVPSGETCDPMKERRG